MRRRCVADARQEARLRSFGILIAGGSPASIESCHCALRTKLKLTSASSCFLYSMRPANLYSRMHHRMHYHRAINKINKILNSLADVRSIMSGDREIRNADDPWWSLDVRRRLPDIASLIIRYIRYIIARLRQNPEARTKWLFISHVLIACMLLPSRMTSSGQLRYKVSASYGFPENRLFLEKENHSGLPSSSSGMHWPFVSSPLPRSSSGVSDRAMGRGASPPAGNVECRDPGHHGSHQNGLWERWAATDGAVVIETGQYHQTDAAGYVKATDRSFNEWWDFRISEATRWRAAIAERYVGVCVRIRLLIVSSTRHDEEAVIMDTHTCAYKCACVCVQICDRLR